MGLFRFVKDQFGRIYTPLTWTILIQVLLCLPGPALPETPAIEIPYFDKIIHVIIFGTFVWLWCLYFSRNVTSNRKLKVIFFCIYLVAAINGIAVEFIQLYYIPFRSFDDVDIIADVLSASVVYGACNVRFLKTE